MDETDLLSALEAEALAVRARVRTRKLGHTSYVTKAMLRQDALELRAMVKLAVRARGMRALPEDTARLVDTIVNEALAEAGGR